MNNPKWHEKNYRRSLVDMHINAWDPSFMSQFDPKAYVDCMIKANVSCCMVYANSHAGYAYWPAPLGNQHPNLKGRDIFGEVADLCHKNNIAVIAYYTLLYDNFAYEQDPVWRTIQADGTTWREHPNGHSGRYGVTCPNSEGYREFTRKQVSDLVRNYDFESVFFDMTFWAHVCYCPNCKTRYEKEIGGNIPRIVDWNDPVWNNFQEHREKWLNEFAWFATNLVKDIKPLVTVNHQYSLITQSWIRGVTEDHTNPCDYVGGDFYAGVTEQGFICKLYNSLSGSFEFHTSRCTGLGDHTTVKPLEFIKLQSCVALAHNGAFLFIDAIDPVGTLNPDFYEKIGPIMKEFAEYEKFLGGTLIADVAILYDLWSKFDYRDNGRNVMEANESIPHLGAVVGAARALKERHIPYTVIGRRNLKNVIGKYKVIVMPDILRLSDEAAGDIRAFVQAGGAVYASGHSGINNLTGLFGIKPIGETSQDMTYMAPNADGKKYMPGSSLKYPLAVEGKQQIVEALPGAEVLAAQVLPYTEKTGAQAFASIHSNPPGRPTSNPAMIRTTFGKGRVIWLAGSIEGRNERCQDDVFTSCIDDLSGGAYSFTLEAPPATEAVCFAQEGGIIASVLNTQTSLPPVTSHGIKLTVDLKGKSCARVLLLPRQTEIPFAEKDGKVSFDLPPLDLFFMFKIVF